MSTASLPARAAGRAPRLRLLGAPATTLAEIATAGAALLVLGVAVFGSHVVNGGFHYDDWSNGALAEYGTLGAWWDLTSYRPLLVVYVPFVHEVLGTHFGLHLAWALALAVLMSACLYLALRTLGVERLHAGAIAALVLVFPWSDATRLWATSSMAHLSISFYLLGSVAAIRGLRAGGWAWHAAAVPLYLLSILTYEIAAGPILASFLLYAAVAGRGLAWRRAAADLAFVVPVLLLVTRDPNKDGGGVSDHLDHLRQIADEGLDVFAASAFPWGAPGGGTALGLALAVAALGLVVMRALPSGDADRAELRRWLAFAGAGAVFTAAAWAVFIPTHPYYSPLTQGVGNRVNVLAAVGLVLVVYALLMVIARMALRGLPRWAARAPLVAAAGAAIVAGGYVERVDEHKEAYDRAYQLERAVLGTVVATVGDPPDGSTIYTFGHPAYYQPGVPVFAATWDLDGALKLQLDDPTVRGYPALAGTRFVCGRDAVHPAGNGYGSPHGAPYGRAFFVDLNGPRAIRIRDRAGCRQAAASFHPGPFELTAG